MRVVWVGRAGALISLRVAVSIALLLALLVVAGPARSAPTTFTVNSTGDENDLDYPGGTFDDSSDGKCDVDSSTANDQCTLRAAIQEANTTTDADTIIFSINTGCDATSGVCTINVGSSTAAPEQPLPDIIQPVTINGYSQTGASPATDTSNAVLKIELDGSNVGDGLTIQAANSTIKGLIINHFSNRSVWLQTPGATGNKIEGNYIGTDVAGTADLGNVYGVYIEGANNTVGGTEAGARNVISGNDGDGVEIRGSSSTGNPILSNSIYENGELGIDLVGGDETASGVTRNDNKDPDTGANRRQNFPVLSSATLSGGQITLSGRLNSRPRKTFTIQFFSSPAADPSGFGEGKTFLGQIQIKTNREGKRSFSTTFFPFHPVSLGEKITATATNNLTSDTSEFSAAKEVT